MEASRERWRAKKWHRAVRSVDKGRQCQMCDSLHNGLHSPKVYDENPVETLRWKTKRWQESWRRSNQIHKVKVVT